MFEMKGKPIRLLCTGKLKTPFWIDACAHYCRLASRWRDIAIVEVKDGDKDASPNKRLAQEAQRLAAKIDARDAIIGLSDTGRAFTSPQFAAMLAEYDLKEAKSLCFVIGGPYGLSAEILEKCQWQLSLSAMTWPHELARVLLLEQIYRGLSILANSPYHH